MLSLNLILVILLATFGVWFWHHNLNARERANRAAMAACERMGLQFLDGTVAFARWNLTRGSSGRLELRRTYIFDYTSAAFLDAERRQGFVVMRAGEMETIGFAPEQSAAVKLASNGPAGGPVAPSDPPAQHRPSAGDSSGKVLDLAEWRRKHHRETDSRSSSRNTWQ
jgi:hypothetical protein